MQFCSRGATVVHNVLQCCQRRTEPRPPVTCTENLVKFGLSVCQTDRQTKRHADLNISHPNRVQIPHGKKQNVADIISSDLLECCLARVESRHADAMTTAIADKLIGMWAVRRVSSDTRDHHPNIDRLTMTVERQ